MTRHSEGRVEEGELGCMICESDTWRERGKSRGRGVQCRSFAYVGFKFKLGGMNI